MADNTSTLYAKAVEEAQKAVQYVLDNAPGAYERGKEAAAIAATRLPPALNSAIEKAPIFMERSKVAAGQWYHNAPRHLNTAKVMAGQLYQDAPRHIDTAKGMAEQLYQDAPRHFDTAKVAGLHALENPRHSAKSLIEVLGPIVRRNPYASVFGVWAALAVVFGPLWPVRTLLRLFGFSQGVTPGK